MNFPFPFIYICHLYSVNLYNFTNCWSNKEFFDIYIVYIEECKFDHVHFPIDLEIRLYVILDINTEAHRGPRGFRGAVGQVGPQGRDGAKGSPGEAGAAGLKGDKGITLMSIRNLATQFVVYGT